MIEVTSDRAWVLAMLKFEAALAGVSASVGLVPADAAEEIVKLCESVELEPEALGRAGREGGNPVIPLVNELRARLSAGTAGWVHFGATSQDTLDTAMMLVGGGALDLVGENLLRAADGAPSLSVHFLSPPLAERTLLQQ